MHAELNSNFYKVCNFKFTVCEVPTDILNGTRAATKTTELADGRTVEDKWKYECDGEFLLIHSQDGVVECDSDSRRVLPIELPRCIKREFQFKPKCLH